MKPEITIVVLNDFADWEAAFLSTALRGGLYPGDEGRFEVRYMTPDGREVKSLGGMRVRPDCDASALPDECAGVVLVGGLSWQSPEAERIVPIVDEARRRGIPVGGICNATLFLAAHGFLDSVRHTGNTSEAMRQWGGDRYRGEELYEERQAVCDGGVVTANGSAYLEFTREYLRLLLPAQHEQIEGWYMFYKNGFYKQ